MRTFALFLAMAFAAADSPGEDHAPTIRGAVALERPGDAAVYVFTIAARDRIDGRAVAPTKAEIFAASAAAGGSAASPDGKYALTVEAPGFYSVFAFADLNGDRRWNPATPEPFGWRAPGPAGRWEPIEVGPDGQSGVDFNLRAPSAMPSEVRHAQGGTLRRIKGYPVLQLHGDAYQRGFAHGQLLAPQIVDFFRFYVLEDKFGSAADYEGEFAKFLHSHFAYPHEYVVECQAVIDGMKAAGASLHLEELGRDFSLTDLYAINGYIETRAMRSSCTQFAAWGDFTAATDVDGGMITGRNMDGEIDLRKVTVSHFLLIAVDPSEAGQKRYVSMMWPGFVGTISGCNEEGFYSMENAGTTGPGGVVDRLVPISWTMREALARLGADATPDSVRTLVDGFDNAAGGVCGPGCITLFAVPYRGQTAPAFVLEGDRFGDQIRLPGDVEPRLTDGLAASNHHRLYGVDPRKPELNFGVAPSFSSQWRYEAGAAKLAAWRRTGRGVGTSEMRELLQTVAHGTTEYAVITRPNQRQFDVATASLEAEPWDAPYREWTSYHFDEVFPAVQAAVD